MSDKTRLARDHQRNLPSLIEAAISIGSIESDSRDVAQMKRLLVAAMWVSLFTSSASLVQLWVGDLPLAALILLASFVTSVGVLLAMWLRPSTYPGVMHVIALVNILVSALLLVLFGGFLPSGANSVWGVVSALGALAIFGDHRATFWVGFYVLVTVGAALWASRIEPVYTFPNPEYFALFNLVVVVLFTYFLLFYFVRQRAALQEESDRLLRNILPDEIADRLKTSEEMIADEFASASILFADVAGFTPMSADMSPNELVSLLDDVFTTFDGLVEHGGLEKIKTIGDAYMVAAGVPVARADHAHAICDLALAMLDEVRSRDFQGRRLDFRIGISSGPVVAGIIGRRKFSYDLWGDSVNAASRMQTAGTVGEIQITESTHRLVEEEFVCEPRGVVDVKGKGPMNVWYLRRRRV